MAARACWTHIYHLAAASVKQSVSALTSAPRRAGSCSTLSGDFVSQLFQPMIVVLHRLGEVGAVSGLAEVVHERIYFLVRIPQNSRART